jgi:hypothetical protein
MELTASTDGNVKLRQLKLVPKQHVPQASNLSNSLTCQLVDANGVALSNATMQPLSDASGGVVIDAVGVGQQLKCRLEYAVGQDWFEEAVLDTSNQPRLSVQLQATATVTEQGFVVESAIMQEQLVVVQSPHVTVTIGDLQACTIPDAPGMSEIFGVLNHKVAEVIQYSQNQRRQNAS